MLPLVGTKSGQKLAQAKQEFAQVQEHLRTKDKDAGDRSYRFEIYLAQLKSLCGVLQLKRNSEAEFLPNENLFFEDDAITVRSRKKLADQISFYRARTGQIIAETK